MTDCLFCKISKKEIPSSKVYEDDKTFAFLDISPISKGHTLVIPKNHSQNIYTMPTDDMNALMQTTQKIANALKKSLKCDGINLGMNNEKPAGQLIMHAHMHVIPRTQGDGLSHWPGKKSEGQQLDALAKDIQQNL